MTDPIIIHAHEAAGDTLIEARDYLASVIDAARTDGNITNAEMAMLYELGYLGTRRPSVPVPTTRHIELEAEMVYLMARRIAARLDRPRRRQKARSVSTAWDTAEAED